MRPRPRTLLALAALLGLGVVGALAPRPAPAAVSVEIEAPPASAPPAVIVVDVQGAVVRPGVYRLSSESRIADALAAAGGLLPDADPAALNRAAPARDGARIYAPLRGETPPAGALGSAAERSLDLNQASAKDLETLPGIGPSTAERIVRSRERAPFRTVDELQTRGLVSPRVLADIRERVTTR